MHRVFDEHTQRYETWFERNSAAYESELEAVRIFLPPKCRGMEIGVGSGRFAAPLGIRDGVEPSTHMLEIARGRGVRAIRGKGEALPYRSGTFDCALLVTTICFVADPVRCCREIHRVLVPGGLLIIGLVDRESFLGRRYEAMKGQNVFYRSARFFSVDEVVKMLEKAGFVDFGFRQTLFSDPALIAGRQRAQPGHGKGAFAVLRAVAP